MIALSAGHLRSVAPTPRPALLIGVALVFLALGPSGARGASVSMSPRVQVPEVDGLEGAPQIAWARRDVINAPNATFAAVVDVDGDGQLDIVAVSASTEQLSWWRNGGDGLGFTERLISRATSGVRSVAPGDFDGDGNADLVTLAPGRGRLGLWLGDGQGNFTDTGYSPLVQTASYVAAADVTGDGRSDLFVVSESTLAIDWWENTGTADAPAFTVHPITGRADATGAVVRITPVDLNGDGRLDFVTANTAGDRINWWLQTRSPDGAISFERAGIQGLREPDVIDVAAADVNGDGRVDILSLRQMPYRVFVWRQTGPGQFTKDTQAIGQSIGERPWPSLDTGDMNGDGAVDFVTPEEGGRLCWYENPTGGAVVTHTATATGGTSTPTPTATEPYVQTETATPGRTEPLTATTTPTATGGTPESGTQSPTPTATGHGEPLAVVIHLPALIKR